MSLIYTKSEDGQQTAHEELHVRDLLARNVLTPETYFWREGMPEWRPLSEFTPSDSRSIAPPRRTQAIAAVARARASNPQVTQPVASASGRSPDPEDGPYLKRKAYGRFYFRRNPVPLTVMLQILILGSIAATGYFTYQCLDKVYGWSNPANADPMLAHILGSDSTATAAPVVSADEMASFYHFLWALICVQVAVEILFYAWVYYGNKNSRGFANNMLYTSGWAVGFFFIPLVNFFRPYQVMQEIWKISDDPRMWLGRRNSIFVGLWFLVRWAVVAVLARGVLYENFDVVGGSPAGNLDTLAYLAVTESSIMVMELTTLILITVVIWRQVRWVRKR